MAFKLLIVAALHSECFFCPALLRIGRQRTELVSQDAAAIDDQILACDEVAAQAGFRVVLPSMTTIWPSCLLNALQVKASSNRA